MRLRPNANHRLRNAALRLGLVLAACAGLALAHPLAATPGDETLPRPFDARAIDRTANACTNFFQFATGTYRAAHPIPPAFSEYGYVEALIERTRSIVRDLLSEADRNPGAPGSDTQKIGDFYAACMDTAAIERAGTAPLAPERARIAAIRTRADLMPAIAHLQTIGIDAAFGVASTQDFHDTSVVVAEIDQGGLGLPERDYYTRSDAESRALRIRYRTHVAKLFALAGDAAATADAATVLAFETVLARASTRAADLRDPVRTYHPTSVTQLAALAPHLNAAAYLRAAHVPRGRFVNVSEPAFVRALDVQLASAPLATWRTYLAWRLIDGSASALPARFEREAFAFNGRILNGAKEQLPRWKRCISTENALLAEAVGRVYVAHEFSPEAKAAATDMSRRIRTAYRDEIRALPWMSAHTKQIAVAKLDAMGLKVGYPDRWRSYAAYPVSRTAHFANIERGRAFAVAFDLAQIGRPVDRAQWSMAPQTVNAYNATLRNEIVLPAAQLQLPFFNAAGDDAANLGATGAGTIGHEMTHGFDDEGHKFDLHGNLRNWWTAQDLRAFDARAACVRTQFDRIAAADNVHYQGRLVSGEAIADLGGVVIGYRALQRALHDHPGETIDGFTPQQRYFLAYAQSWSENVRPEAARTQALGDPHPLPRDRVNATLLNVPAWYEAFSCPKPPRPVCSIW